ncbi:MAG: ATP-binding protein [Gemmatimonadaceae bacterium]
MRAWPASVRLRLTLWYSALLALPLVAFALVCYLVFAQALHDRTDRFIGDAVTAFSRELIAERRVASGVEEAMRSTVEEVHFRDLRIAILDSAGHLVAGSTQGNIASVSAAPGAVAGDRVHTVATPEGNVRVLARPFASREGLFVVVGTYSMADIDAVLARIRDLFAIAIPVLVLVAATGGSLLAKRSLVPVEQSFEQQRRFMADASHELRTPVAILRTEADLTLSREHRGEGEYRASMTVMRDATARLTRIVDDLFLLARADSGHLTPRCEPFHLEDVLHDATSGVRSIADRRNIDVALGQVVEAPFEGDADLVGRLVLNLVSNAIRYSPEGGRVDVSLARRDASYEISVVDAGPGVPTEAIEHLFERFFRVGDDASGAGLGLAIAQRIAELHDGRVTLIASGPGRTEFRVTLPAPAERG